MEGASSDKPEVTLRKARAQHFLSAIQSAIMYITPLYLVR